MATYQNVVDRLNASLAPDGRALPQVMGAQLSILLQWRDGTEATWAVEGLSVTHSERLASAWAAYPRWMQIVDLWGLDGLPFASKAA